MTILQEYLSKSLHDFMRPFDNVLSRPNQKKVRAMLKGMIEGKTVQLSEAGRQVEKELKPKKFCEKVGTCLSNIQELKKVQLFKGHKRKLEFLILDESDCQRTYAQKLDGVEKIRDGSTGDLYGQGYALCSVVARTQTEEYLPLILERLTNGKISLKNIIHRLLHTIGPDHGATWLLDRGYDDRKIFDLLLKEEQQFLIRLDCQSSQRLLEVGEGEETETHLVSELVAHVKQIGYRRVRLPGRQEILTLLCYRRHPNRPPLVLLTTHTPKTEKQALRIAKQYLKRWKIEDYFRFVKQSFQLEQIMLQIPERVDGLLTLVLLASSLVMKLEKHQRADKILYGHYIQWLNHNHVATSWSAMARFLCLHFRDWHLVFRIRFPALLSDQLALAFI